MFMMLVFVFKAFDAELGNLKCKKYKICIGYFEIERLR